MKRFGLVFFVLLFLFAGCETTNSTLLTEGKKAAELLAAKDKQIQDQSSQIDSLKSTREIEQKEASKAASSVRGILKANEYQPPGKPTEAIKEEAQVALQRLPKDDPAETVKALERAVEMVTGQRDKALSDYAAARKDADIAKKIISEKDEEILKRESLIIRAQENIVKLEKEKQQEQIKAALDLKNKLDGKDKEISDLIKKYEDKEKAWWTNAARIAGLGLIVIGALLLAVLKMLPEGAGLIAAGTLVGVVSIFLDWLTSQWWFPYATGVILLITIACVGYGIYRAWKTKMLHFKTVAALQDLKDEAGILGHDTWEKLSEHLKYRLGNKDSFWGKEQINQIAALGLINPKAESLAQSKVDNLKD